MFCFCSPSGALCYIFSMPMSFLDIWYIHYITYVLSTTLYGVLMSLTYLLLLLIRLKIRCLCFLFAVSASYSDRGETERDVTVYLYENKRQVVHARESPHLYYEYAWVLSLSCREAEFFLPWGRGRGLSRSCLASIPMKPSTPSWESESIWGEVIVWWGRKDIICKEPERGAFTYFSEEQPLHVSESLIYLSYTWGRHFLLVSTMRCPWESQTAEQIFWDLRTEFRENTEFVLLFASSIFSTHMFMFCYR